ncbi:YdcF family protein [Sphingomonas koreensis]|nr:YdcF family protein [Sphingomonas koreensis]
MGHALTGSIAIIAIAPAGYAAPATQDAILAVLAHRLFPAIIRLNPDTAPAAARSLLSQRQQRFAACDDTIGCRIDALKWTDSDIAVIADFAAKQEPARADEIRAAVRRELAGVNAILQVYGAGIPPRYPKIDGPEGVGTPQFGADVAAALASAEIIRGEPIARLDRSIAVALTLLDGANRLDSVAFEPLDSENATALARAASLDWSRYPYTAIILLGVGPEVDGMPLSPLSKLNVHMAAARYRAGVAPFIIVSGAGVHPRRTPFNEAIEMRKALIERYGIPADAIVLEPYARHTTTNLRNAARLLIGLGAPSDRPALIVTNLEHGASISNQAFVDRNIAELGYEPGKIGAALSPYEFPFVYDRKSLRVDPADPLDP